MTEIDQKFIDYLNSLDMSTTSANRVREIYQFYVDTCKFQIDDIFISEYVDKDGKRIFENLWFISKGIVMEARNFISQDEYDMALTANNIDRWFISKRDFDFKTASRMSRLTVNFEFRRAGLSGVMKATGDNCLHLMMLFKKYILPPFQI